MAMGEGNQIADRARPHALLLAMVPLVVVVALDLPVHIHRRDIALHDEMLLDRSWRVEEKPVLQMLESDGGAAYV
jgi:hypothetical protein